MRKKDLIIFIGLFIVGVSLAILSIAIALNIPKDRLEIGDNIETTSIDINTTQTTKTSKKTVKTTKNTTSKEVVENLKSNTYKLTHYGADCKACSGITASGYDVRKTIYYNDTEYGKIRIVAMKSLPFYSIIKIKDYKLGGDIIAIVLDRGVGSGVIDLLANSEAESSKLGIQTVEMEVLRNGKK